MDWLLYVLVVVFLILFTDLGAPLVLLWGLWKTRNMPDPPDIKNARPANYNIEPEMDAMLAADRRRREQQQQQQMQQQQYQQQMYQQQIDQQMQQQMSMGSGFFGF